MTTVLRIGFPARRYHATPWGHQVNEAQVEWPPSPWRLLRALAATGFTKLRWPGDRPPPLACALLERLAAVTPSFRLPAAATAHTRQYVPAAGKQTLIFDAWAQIDAGEIEVCWPVLLPAEERALLDQLVQRLGYLGRAESWVEAWLVDEVGGSPDAMPAAGGAPGVGWEAISLMAPDAPETYASWRAGHTAGIEATFGVGKPTKASAKKREKALAPYPVDLVGCLLQDNGVVQQHGWSRPPGSRDVLYWRRPGALQARSLPRRAATTQPAPPFALLSLTTASRSHSALPSVERTWARAMQVHISLASHAGRLGVDADTAAALLGRRAPAAAPETGHQHAHILPLALADGRHVDHFLIWVPAGIGEQAQAVIRSVRRTWAKGVVGDLQLAVAGMGERADLGRMRPPWGSALAPVLGPAAGALVWQSATPLFLPRFTKARGRNTALGQIRQELAQRGLPLAVVEILDPAGIPQAARFRHFAAGDHTRKPPSPRPWCVRLVFDQPVRGPLTLGWGSHQGLGRFDAVIP